MVNFGEFLKTKDCGQTALPDRSILIGQKMVEMPKLTNTNATFWVIFKHCDAKNKTFLAPKTSIFKYHASSNFFLKKSKKCNFFMVGKVLKLFNYKTFFRTSRVF